MILKMSLELVLRLQKIHLYFKLYFGFGLTQVDEIRHAIGPQSRNIQPPASKELKLSSTNVYLSRASRMKSYK